MSSRLYQFSGTHLGAIEWCDPVGTHALVADSWRMESGKSVALDRHWRRFSTSALNTGLDDDVLRAFWVAVREALPPEGSWFPRIEVVATSGGPTLRYREREAPAWTDTVSLARADHDPRSSPLTKGPDLEKLMALRRSVEDVGASEALIVSPGGVIIEGAYSTVVAWKAGADFLSVVGAQWARIPSVTESVLRDIAKARGVGVAEGNLSVDDLDGAEVWILSALHGIRVATGFHNGPHLGAAAGRRDDWQAAWWATRAPVSQGL